MIFNTKNIPFLYSLLLLFPLCIVGMEVAMPQNLSEKMTTKKLAPQCAFLLSVYEKDYDSVTWMLDHPYTKFKEKDPLFYYSIYTSDLYRSFLTPFMIANHNNDERMLTLLQPLQPTQPKGQINKCLMKSNTIIPYDLYMAACSKDINVCSTNITQLLPNEDDDLDATYNKNMHTNFLFLAAIMNSDATLFRLMKTQLWNSEDASFNHKLEYAFCHAIGLGDNHATFYTEEEIKRLINHSFLTDKKGSLLKAVMDFNAYIKRLSKLHSAPDNKQLMKAAQLLIDSGAKEAVEPLPLTTSTTTEQKKWNMLPTFPSLLFVAVGVLAYAFTQK